jgi:hypothetical protein
MHDKSPEERFPVDSLAVSAVRHDPRERVTAEGIIETGAHRNNFALEFLSVLDTAVEQLRALKSDCSLYVYGSVATGTARVGFSDVDLLSVDLDTQSACTLGEKLSTQFRDVCRSVEIGAGQPSGYVGTDDESYGNRVFLRHYCVHLTGPDIRANLPDFRADAPAARGFNGDIGIHAKKWRAELSQTEDLAPLGRRIARKTLLAVSGLVSIHDHIWTTDRVAAAQRWREVVPEFADELNTLLIWSNTLSPQLSDAEIRTMLDGVVAKVVDDFTHQIGLWNHSDVR